MTEESRVYRSAMRATVILVVGLAVIAVPVGLLVADGTGLIAALVGVAVAALSGITTQVAMLVGHRQPPHVMAAYVAGSWLLKMIIIVVSLLLLSRIDDFHRELFAAFAVAGVLGTLGVDMWALRKGRVPYADPGSK